MAFDLKRVKTPRYEDLSKAVEEHTAPRWAEPLEQELEDFDTWQRAKYPARPTNRSLHAAGNAYDMNVDNHEDNRLRDWGEAITRAGQVGQYMGIPLRPGPRPVSYIPRPWAAVEEAAKLPTQAEIEKYETVCIWCGITCSSIEELEEHEADCE